MTDFELKIVSLITELRKDFIAHNDHLLPAIEAVISDHLNPMVLEIVAIKQRLSKLENEVQKLKRA